MLHRAARNAYSWWWASHIRTKQSKWLEQKLQDMEEKVEYILKIINEDGDSFAVRAEMYYRKRPELVNFVEDCFRGYRALAERYDHLSRELQSANRTIATVYPERVQLAMDEDDEETFLTTSTPFHETNKPPKGLPAAPKLSIPKIPNIPKKNTKPPSRLMSKKGLLKISATDALPATKSSGLSKAEALQEIDKLQKEILVLQTEEEFIKSSCESGLAKYWDIEKQVTEMQAKVSSLEDEFGIGTVIEDDEARTLMAATALKSCHQTLVRIQKKHEQSIEDTRIEYQRIQEIREKFDTLKEQLHSNKMHRQELSGKQKSVSTSSKLKDSMEEGRHDLELLQEKIKEQLLVNADPSLTISELAETIDELVDEVINFETVVSSQTALVMRLRSETDELQAHLQILEAENQTLIEGSDSKSNKIRELEEELGRVQSLNQSVKDQNKNLEIRITKTSSNINHLSVKLQNAKPDDEINHMTLFKEARAVPGDNPAKQLQVHEDMASPHYISGIPKEKKTEEEKKKDDVTDHSAHAKSEREYSVQSNPSNPFVSLSQDISDSNPEKAFKEHEMLKDASYESVISTGYESVISKGLGVEEEVKKDDSLKDITSVSAEVQNSVQFNLSNHLADLSQKGQVRAVLAAIPEKGFKESEDMMAPGDSVISKKDVIPYHSTSVEAEEENFAQSNHRNHLDALSKNGQLKAVSDENPEKGFKEHEHMTAPGHDSVISEDTQIEGERNVDDFPDHHPTKAKEEIFGQSNPSICLVYLSEGHVGNVLDAKQDKGSKVREDVVAPGNGSVTTKDAKKGDEEKKDDIGYHSTSDKAGEEYFYRSYPSKQLDDLSGLMAVKNDTRMAEEKNDDFPDYTPSKVEENFVQSNLENQLDLSENVEVRAALDTNLETGFKAHESMKASSNDSVISREMKTEERKDKIQDVSTSVKTKDGELHVQSNPTNHLDDHSGKGIVMKEQQKDEKQGLSETVDSDAQELDVDEENQPNWKQLFLNGLEDREKILLQEYTSTLRNYKEVKKKLSEVEKKNRTGLFKSAMQIKVLRNANASKDSEIQSLHSKLNLLQTTPDEIPGTHESMTRSSFQVSNTSSPNSNQTAVPEFLDEWRVESKERTEESSEPEHMKVSYTQDDEGEIMATQDDEGEIMKICIDEPPVVSSIEEKIRMDIDDLLEENIEFWLRFSTSFHQIQKFQTSFQDLQAELMTLKENKKHDGNTKHQPLNSDVRPIYKHLREIQTELILWLEHNGVLKDDLQNRLSSLSGIQDEISRLSSAGSQLEETELSEYKAAKFQGEVMNMQQENKKVADELLAGLERVKRLQIEIEKTLTKLDEELGKNHQTKTSSGRSRIPLRSFLFGVRLKKQKPSLFACMSPALQKQYSDLTALQP